MNLKGALLTWEEKITRGQKMSIHYPPGDTLLFPKHIACLFQMINRGSDPPLAVSGSFSGEMGIESRT